MEEDFRRILNEYKEETKRHFDVVAEGIRDEIRKVLQKIKQKSNNNERDCSVLQTKRVEFL